MQTHDNTERADVWAVTGNGDVLFREGVRVNCPEGNAWTQVKADVQFQVRLIQEDQLLRHIFTTLTNIKGHIGRRWRLKSLGAG